MSILLAAVALLATQSALAEQRENKAFNTVNGRTITSAPGGGHFIRVNTPGAGFAANQATQTADPGAAQAPAVTGNMINGAPADGGRTFIGRQGDVGRTTTGRGVRKGGGKTIMSRAKVRRTDSGGAADPPPPNFDKPGALIRTTGQLPLYEKTTVGTHTVDAGEIVLNERKARDVGRGPSIQIGTKDILPPPNPTSSGGSYGSGASANSASPTTTGGGTGGSHDNNGSGNNDKGTDSQDSHGGDKAKESSFYDAY